MSGVDFRHKLLHPHAAGRSDAGPFQAVVTQLSAATFWFDRVRDTPTHRAQALVVAESLPLSLAPAAGWGACGVLSWSDSRPPPRPP